MNRRDACLLSEFFREVAGIVKAGLVGDFGDGEARVGQEALGPLEPLGVQIGQRGEAEVFVKQAADVRIAATQRGKQGLDAASFLPAIIQQFLGCVGKLRGDVALALFR